MGSAVAGMGSSWTHSDYHGLDCTRLFNKDNAHSRKYDWSNRRRFLLKSRLTRSRLRGFRELLQSYFLLWPLVIKIIVKKLARKNSLGPRTQGAWFKLHRRPWPLWRWSNRWSFGGALDRRGEKMRVDNTRLLLIESLELSLSRLGNCHSATPFPP